MSSISKTYKITGTAWIDADKDGMRSDTETLMKGVKATLVDSDAGVIKQTTVTNSNGEYTFTGVKNGNYIIIFENLEHTQVLTGFCLYYISFLPIIFFLFFFKFV